MFIAWLVGFVCVLVYPFFYLFLHTALMGRQKPKAPHFQESMEEIRPHVGSDSIKSRRVLTWNEGPGSVVCSNVRP